MPNLFSLLRGNRHCRALFTTFLVCLDHENLNLSTRLSRDGERYVDAEMKRALFGVKRMKEVMEKNQEKHEHLMKTLKESKAELNLQKAEEQCHDSLRTSFMECRPCLEDTCKTFYTSTCRRGFSSFSFKVEEFFRKLSSQLETPDQVVNQNQDNLNQTQNSDDPDLELVRLNASFSQMQGKMSSLHNRSTELVNKMHQEFGHGFWVAFTNKLKPKPLFPTQESPSGGFFMGMGHLGSMGLDDVLEEVYDFGRAVVEDLTDVLDEMQKAVDEESWQQRESFPSWSWVPVPFPDMYLCRQLRRQASECWQLQRLCESCQDTLVKECPSVRELHSALEETYLLLNTSRLQYEEMLQVVQKHTDDTNNWLNTMEAKYGWVTQLTNGTLGPHVVICFQVVLQVRDDGFKGDTRVALNILNSPTLTLSVPAELEVQDSAFIQYVAQEALAHYKQSKVSIKPAARQNVHAMITVPRQFLII
uniref:Clusterin n=1 Tax=Hucho hucho TaxID=62062 RepID=A0A4W5KNC9_9TELE